LSTKSTATKNPSGRSIKNCRRSIPCCPYSATTTLSCPGELRELTAQRIAALELRAYTLSNRTPECTDEYIEHLRKNLPKQRELLAAAEEKIEELKGKLGRK
jgi:hypothetical protein